MKILARWYLIGFGLGLGFTAGYMAVMGLFVAAATLDRRSSLG